MSAELLTAISVFVIAGVKAWVRSRTMALYEKNARLTKSHG